MKIKGGVGLFVSFLLVGAVAIALCCIPYSLDLTQVLFVDFFQKHFSLSLRQGKGPSQAS